MKTQDEDKSKISLGIVPKEYTTEETDTEQITLYGSKGYLYFRRFRFV